jgi:PAS domain S-box-containing protein
VLGGTSDTDLVIGRRMVDLWGEEFAELLRDQTEALFRSGKGETVEEEVLDSSRNRKAVFLSNKVPLFNEDGTPLGVLGVSRDITDMKRVEQELRENEARLAEQVEELKAAHQREQLLAREVDHRAKNLLAVVQSVVQLSRAGSVEELKEGLTGRIQALARAHSLLADSRWEGVALTQLAEEELAPFRDSGAGRVSCAGPPVLLRPSAAQSLALILHELTTNAAKYGALSKPGGSLDVEWRMDGDTLVLDWLEAGGSEVTAPAETGFGTRLITTSVDRQLRGQVDRQWNADGLRCTLRIPSVHAVVA